MANVDKQLANPPKPLQFDGSGVAKLTHWEPKQQEGDATAEPFEESGKPPAALWPKHGRGGFVAIDAFTPPLDIYV